MLDGMAPLFAAESKNLVATLRSASQGDRARAALFLLLLSAFVVSAEYLTYRLFRAFFQVGDMTDEFIALLLATRLLGMIFLVVIALLFFGAMIAAIDTLYFHPDIDFLASRPIGRGVILTKKLVSIYLTSAWVVFLVVVPVMIGYGRSVGNAFGHLPLSLVALFLYSLAPVALGSAFVVLLMRFLPVDKGKEGVLAAGALLSFALIYLYRLLSPAQFYQGGQKMIENFGGWVREFTLPMSGVLPSTTMSQALLAAVPGKTEVFLEHAAWLGAGALGAISVYFLLGQALFETDRPVSADAAAPGPIERLLGAGNLIRRAARLAPRGAVGIVYREITMHLRDPMQISHIFLMVGVVALHFANLGEMPRFIPHKARILISFLNLGLVGFLLAGVAVRFVYPAVSLEGNSLWRLQAAPLTPERFVAIKFLMAWIPLAIASTIVVAVSNHLIGAGLRITMLWIFAVLAICTVIAALGVAMGIAFPALDRKNVFEISSSPGGIVFMVASLLYVGLTILVLVRPAYLNAFQPDRFYSFRTVGAVLFLAVSSLLIARVSLRTGARAFANFEERR